MTRPKTNQDLSATSAGTLGRRAFTVGLLSSFALGCNDDGEIAQPNGPANLPAAADPDLVAVHPFVGEGPIGVGKSGVGLDARQRLDLSTIGPRTLEVGADAFYVRTERPDLLPNGEPRIIVLGGLVEKEIALAAADVVTESRRLGSYVMECAGNTRESGFGLLSATSFSGVPIAEILAKVSPTVSNARVLVSGFDGHSRPSAGGHSTAGASWIFSRAELEARGAFLATHMAGVPLLADHGAPARLFVPGYYGCSCIKWVDRIELVPDDAPATTQMKEFAGRTHQHYAFETAREYAPPFGQSAALCTRAEHRRVDGKLRLVLRGIVWGGEAPSTLLRVFVGNAGGDPVIVSNPAASSATWGTWEHVAPPLGRGQYQVRLVVEPIATPQRRLDSGWYNRTFEVRG